MEGVQKAARLPLTTIPNAARPPPQTPIATRKRGAKPDLVATAPRAQHSIQAQRQAFNSGASLFLADQPHQVGHRGVPVLIPASVQKGMIKKTAEATPPSHDEDSFPALPAARLPLSISANNSDRESHFAFTPQSSKAIGDGHVTEPEPRGDSEFESQKIGETIGDLILAESSVQDTRESAEQLATVGKESETQARQAGLGSWETRDDEFLPTPPAPNRTREAQSFYTCELLSVIQGVYNQNASNVLNGRKPSRSIVGVVANTSSVSTPTKTQPSDAVLVARGRAAAPQPQTEAAAKEIAATHNPLQAGAQQSYKHFSGNPFRAPAPQQAPPIRPYRRWQVGVQSLFERYYSTPPQPSVSPQASSLAVPLGSQIKSPQHWQTARMGSGPSNEAPASPSQHRSEASAATQGFDRSAGQSAVTRQAGQNHRAQAYSQPGVAVVGVSQQGQLGYPSQSAGLNQPSYKLHHSQEPNKQQVAFAEIQSNFGPYQDHASQLQRRAAEQRESTRDENARADYMARNTDQASSVFLSEPNATQTRNMIQQQMSAYTRSPSEISFQQMPGAFEPNWSRSFDALPPASISSDHHSSASSQRQLTGQPQIVPGFGISQDAAFNNQEAVVPARLPVMEAYHGTQLGAQEPLSHEPQYAGKNVSQPHELAAQADVFAQLEQSSVAFSQPFIPPPAEVENRASFNVPEAQNDKQTIGGLPSFVPDHRQFIAPSQGARAVPQSSFAPVDTGYADAVSDAYDPSLRTLPTDSNGGMQTALQLTAHPTSNTAQQIRPESGQLHQAMDSRRAGSSQQNAVVRRIPGGFSLEDIEIVQKLGANQDMPPHLEEKFRSIMGFDSDDEFPAHRRSVRAVSPPRIVGGIHHASRHASPNRSVTGRRSHSPSATRSPLQHTQPRIQLPVLPPPAGIVYKPSPYSMSRPAKAGDETSTEYLNRMLMIAKQDQYLPSHMTFHTDVSETAFERAFPRYRTMSRASMAYRMVYKGWAMKNRTHVPLRIVPPGLKNWMTMEGSDAWGMTVDPRENLQVTFNEGLQPLPTMPESSKTDAELPAAFPTTTLDNKSTTALSRKGKGREPAPNAMMVDEGNQETSIDDDAEYAMFQHAIELSRRESLALVSSPNRAGPAPKEGSAQPNFSTEAPPSKLPATEDVAPDQLKKRRGSRGGSQSRKSSQALRNSKEEVVASAASKSSSSTAPPTRPGLSQAQKSQPIVSMAQQFRKASDGINPALLVVKGNTLAYIPSVASSINVHAIRSVLGRFGGPVHVDIDRRKGCAFVEFASPAGYRAAIAANPHKIGRENIRVQPRTEKRPSGATAQTSKPTVKAVMTPDINPWPEMQLTPAKAAEESEVEGESRLAWPNAPKPVARAFAMCAGETKDMSTKSTAQPLVTSDSKSTLKSTTKAAWKAPKPKTPEPSTADEAFKPTTLLEPPKTPPKFVQAIIPATPPTPRTEALIRIHSVVGTQDKNLLALPEVEEVMENPPIIKKSVKTSRRAVEKAAKKAKALLAKESRAEVAGARLGMGKGVLEQIGSLAEADSDANVTDEETGKKTKKPAAPKKALVKGIQVIPGVEINENHSKDVHVDRSQTKDKFVISRGQLKEIDLEKKARKEKEVADTQLAHKLRAAEMRSRGKALASSTDDWEELEDRMAAAETAVVGSRRGSSTGLGAGGPPVLMALGADFDGWKSTIPRPPPPSSTDSRPDPRERPDTAMSMRSNISGASSSFLALFPFAPALSAKDPSQFVEPAVIPPPLNRHIVPAQSLSEIIAAEAALRGGQPEKPAAAAKPVASSWAQLAASKSSASTSGDTSRRASSEVIELRSRGNSNVGHRNLMSRFSKIPVAIKSIKYDTNEENKRTVYILGVPESTTLTDVSDSVSSGGFGAIYKIEFATDEDTGLRLAGILFRDAGKAVPGIHGKAWGAIGYYTALKSACDADYLKEPPLWPWPLDAPITVYNQEYPEEELMRRMHHDHGSAKKGVAQVTRRLCIVNRTQLHADWHEEEMIAFCHASGVKQGNVQKCCVHNFGNSTIVFGSVEDAVLMREKLLEKFAKSKDMSVTFSSCPGETVGPIRYKRDNAYLRHLEKTMGVDVELEIEEGFHREKRRRNSKWTAY